jgi:hypothetical protein
LIELFKITTGISAISLKGLFSQLTRLPHQWSFNEAY